MNTSIFKRVLRRAPCERATGALIGLGLVMLMQPWAIEIYSYGFTVLLAGVVGFSIAGKLPDGEIEPPRSLRSLPPEGAVASLGRPGGGKR